MKAETVAVGEHELAPLVQPSHHFGARPTWPTPSASGIQDHHFPNQSVFDPKFSPATSPTEPSANAFQAGPAAPRCDILTRSPGPPAVRLRMLQGVQREKAADRRKVGLPKRLKHMLESTSLSLHGASHPQFSSTQVMTEGLARQARPRGPFANIH